jgi:hypothetical protein
MIFVAPENDDRARWIAFLQTHDRARSSTHSNAVLEHDFPGDFECFAMDYGFICWKTIIT